MKPECVIVSTWSFGDLANQAAARSLRAGNAPLEALEKGINAVEDDPTVTSVGYGGEPNAEATEPADRQAFPGLRSVRV